MQRVLSSVTLLGLLVATAAAFAITEHLKQIKSPVYGPRWSSVDDKILKTFSPTCRCITDRAQIGVRLRRPTTVTVKIVDSQQNVVRTLAIRQHEPKGRADWTWDGHSDDGTIAPDGVYKPEVSLPKRTLLLSANRIVVDTTPPKALSAPHLRKANGVLLGGPGRSIAIEYSFSEPAHAAVYLGQRLIVFGHKTKQPGKVKWSGRIGGRPLPAGKYVLSVGAQDVAGNQIPAAQRKDVTVDLRYVQLSPRRLTVRRGSPLSVHVTTAARRYAWRLGNRHGTRRGRTLRLRAPTTPGTYHLVVSENGQSTAAVVQVRAK